MKVEGEGGVGVFYQGKEIVRGKLEPAPAHCPDQAFITLCERCVFDCKYCPVPKLQGHVKSDEEVLNIIDEVLRAGNLKAISLTSGVETSVEGEVERVIKLLPALKKNTMSLLGFRCTLLKGVPENSMRQELLKSSTMLRLWIGRSSKKSAETFPLIIFWIDSEKLLMFSGKTGFSVIL